jgi:uncharacterized protein (TIGR02145 family)
MHLILVRIIVQGSPSGEFGSNQGVTYYYGVAIGEAFVYDLLGARGLFWTRDDADVVGTITYYSVEKSGVFTRNNCGTGYTGSSVAYIVIANTYESIVSQADADAQAQADVDANGQAYANANSTCIPDMVDRYGYLYNWYAVVDAKNIANTGWRVPTLADFVTLQSTLDPDGDETTNTAGGDMKETGTTYWDSPNTGATNNSGFNARASGVRSTLGDFVSQKVELRLFSSSDYTEVYSRGAGILYNSSRFVASSYSPPKTAGLSLRLVKITTALTNGQTSTYIGNDGKVYDTICIGNQEWLSLNLRETKYRDGSTITEAQGSVGWLALGAAGLGALCYYV